jgi:hypothetical protein
MALATFHSLRGEKSALIMVKANAFVFGATPVYVPKDSIPSTIKEGMSFEIPDGYKIVPFIDFETGAIRTTKEGVELHSLAY